MALDQIPDEILGDIFLKACPRINLVNLSKPYIGLLSRVCTRWRMLVVNDPRLWSQILLHALPRPDRCLSQYQAGVVQLALERSQTYPLTIKYTATCNENSRKYEKTFELLYSAANRWYDVELDGVLFTLMVQRNGQKWASGHNPMHMLRSLRLSRCDHPDSLLGSFMGLSSTGTLPSLTHLTLIRFASISNIAGKVTNRGFPWSQLTHLCLKKGSESAWMELGAIDDFFRQVPNLVDLVIKPLQHSLRRKRNPAILSHLKTLSISIEFGVGPWVDALSFIEAPNLSVLNIGVGSPDVDSPIMQASIVPFLQQSSCTLRHISMVNLNTRSAREILRHTPSVTSLLVDLNLSTAIEGCNGKLLEALTWKPTESSENVLPNLADLDIKFIRYPCPANYLSRIIQSRADTITCTTLKSMHTIYSASCLFDSYAGMQHFRPLWSKHMLKGGLVVSSTSRTQREEDRYMITPDWQFPQ